jgi:hypothetical protein
VVALERWMPASGPNTAVSDFSNLQAAINGCIRPVTCMHQLNFCLDLALAQLRF